MNINLVMMKVKHSDMDDGMKQSIYLILDKALGDGDIVARLEDEIRELEKGPLENPFLIILKRIKDEKISE